MTSNIINAILILIGCAEIGIMWAHQGVVMAFFEDAILGPRYYYFLNPYVKIIYGVAAVALIGKEFFIKKPIKTKIKINIIAVIILILLIIAQMLIWQYAIGKYFP
jgi:hypothetical protein